MNGPAFEVVPLNVDAHDRAAFNCGTEPLNRYFSQQVTQDIRRRIATCFVATSPDNRIVGYYTLASASIPLTDLPEKISKKLPRYPTIPAIRMGRLAVEESCKGKGLGGALLADALIRAASAEIAAYALVVDAKDDSAAEFYRYHGFISLPESTLTLFLPLASVSREGVNSAV